MQENKTRNCSIQNNYHFPLRNCISFLLLTIIIWVSYGNSLHNSWHLDDTHTIIRNPKLHITNLSFNTLNKTLRASTAKGYYNSNKIYRPIPDLTFALNWLVGQNKVMGYHLVNIIIHTFTAFVLLLTIQLLLLTPNCRTGGEQFYTFIPLFTTVLWAISPIQVSAVTYIVQRMAICATFFIIASIFFYLKARLNSTKFYKVIYAISCLIAFILAIGSKENSIMLPLCLVLIEFLFFQDLGSPKIKKVLLQLVCLLAFSLIALIAMYALNVDFIKQLFNYSNRPFTLVERLLTEPRVIVLYLSLIFYPSAERLSFQHDISLSTSFLSPPSTLFAIALIVLLIFIGLQQSKKRPLLSLGILFYFLNHIIESTFIPLELTFQHRNYLPSLFVFLPVSLAAFYTLKYLKDKKITRPLIVASFSLIISATALGTYSRNKVWFSDETLWLDVHEKYPNLFRPYFVLAKIEEIKGNSDRELFYLQKGLSLASSAQAPAMAKVKALTAIALNNFHTDNFDAAIKSCQEALRLIPLFDIARRPLISSYIAQGDWNNAELVVDQVLSRRPSAPYYLKAKGLILLQQDKPNEAIPILVKAMRKDINDWHIPLFLGVSLDKIGKKETSMWFLQKARKLSPSNQVPLLYIINNRLAVDKKSANQYIKILLSNFDTLKIKDVLNKIKAKHFYPAIQTKAISKAIADELETRISILKQI